MGVSGVCAARASECFWSENKWDAIGASFLVKNGKAAAAPVVAPAGRPRCWVSVWCAGGDGRDAIAGDAAEIAREVEV